MVPKTILEISEYTKTSKQYIAHTLKKCMKKVYKSYKRNNPKLNPLEIVMDLAYMFNMVTEKDYKCFFNDFPKDVKDEVKKYATNNNYVSLKSNFINEVVTINDTTNVSTNSPKKRRGRPPKIRV